MSNNNQDEIDVVALIALGILVVTGAGIWLVLKAFGGFEKGEEVDENDLIDAGYEPPSSQTEDELEESDYTPPSETEQGVCSVCGTIERCNSGHCLECVGSCPNCGRCGECYGCGSYECSGCQD